MLVFILCLGYNKEKGDFMRIRNVKNKKELLDNCKIVLKDPEKYKGKWNNLFGNNNPIYLEIGSGKCGFIKKMADKYSDINFIGIEKLDTVLAIGVRDIKDYNNLYLTNYNANLIEKVFDHEIDKLFLNFSDPWPKDRHEKRRLTSSNLLKKYETIFKKTKNIALKTDNREFFEYSIKSLVDNGYLIKTISLDLHNSKISDNIFTEYEEKFAAQNMKIYFLEVYKN